MYRYGDLHRVQGQRAHAQGQRFEEILEMSFAWYRAQGLAEIEKTPEPMRVVERLGGGKFVAFFEKKAQADYAGVLAGGRAVALEAKFTSGARLEQSRITPEQGDFLEARQRLGALCFVVAGFAGGNVYRLPWVAWRDMKDVFGRKSVTEADLAEFRVPEREVWPMVLEGLV